LDTLLSELWNKGKTMTYCPICFAKGGCQHTNPSLPQAITRQTPQELIEKWRSDENKRNAEWDLQAQTQLDCADELSAILPRYLEVVTQVARDTYVEWGQKAAGHDLNTYAPRPGSLPTHSDILAEVERRFKEKI